MTSAAVQNSVLQEEHCMGLPRTRGHGTCCHSEFGLEPSLSPSSHPGLQARSCSTTDTSNRTQRRNASKIMHHTDAPGNNNPLPVACITANTPRHTIPRARITADTLNAPSLSARSLHHGKYTKMTIGLLLLTISSS